VVAELAGAVGPGSAVHLRAPVGAATHVPRGRANPRMHPGDAEFEVSWWPPDGRDASRALVGSIAA